MQAVSVLMKPASSMCNMSCDYCFYCDEAEKRTRRSFGMMSEQTLKNVIRKTMLRTERMACYAYQGGEPTLRGLDFFEKAVALQNQYNKNHIQVQNALQTNGYLIDEAWCEFLRDNHFLVGLSVDGTSKIHNGLRHDRKDGGETFEKVINAARLMDRYGVDYNILTVVTPEIAENIQKVYGFYKENGWNYQQYIACLDPLGEGHGKTPYALKPEVYGQFLVDLFELWFDDLMHGRQPFIRQFENWAGILSGYKAEACDQRGICSIYYVVEADGSVYPCDFYMLDEYCLGNFNADRVDAIDKKREEIGFVERSKKLVSSCRKCSYYGVCHGGCQRNRDLDPVSGLYENYFCKAYQMFFDKCYERFVSVCKKGIN